MTSPIVPSVGQTSGGSATNPASWELVIGLVGPIGTDLGQVCAALKRKLVEIGCTPKEVRLIELLHELPPWKDLPHGSERERYVSHINAGNRFCEDTSLPDALARLAVGAIRKIRRDATQDSKRPAPRHVYVLRSLKRPTEVELLRRIYGPSFLLVACHSPRAARVRRLSELFLDSLGDRSPQAVRADAEELVARDEFEGFDHGQNVRDTFQEADLFVDTANPSAVELAVARFLALVFRYPYHTPTVDEYCMFHARGAALRSSDLSRQVGAAIATARGEVLALGTNEVPRALGGQYWEGDDPDDRDFRRGVDASMRYRRRLLADALRRLSAAGILDREKVPAVIDRDYIERLLEEAPDLRHAMIMDALEYGRAVHAEMAAISEAARRGVAVQACQLYTTTFPCHECARHIVASGLREVVYIQPYPKSAAEALFSDSPVVDTSEPDRSKVRIRPFVGVAPRQYQSFFAMPKRKDSATGEILAWNGRKEAPRASSPAGAYLPAELAELSTLQEAMLRAGIHLRSS